MRINLARVGVKTLVTLTLLAPFASAGDPARPTDADLTKRVQTVLAADPALKARSLVVSVVDGVAVVGGPVATTEEAARVTQLLRVVPELTDVKVSAWVPTAENPLKAKVAEKLKAAERPTATVRDPADPRPSGRVVVQRFSPAVPMPPLLLDPVPQAASPLLPRRDSAYSPVPVTPPPPDGTPPYPTIPSPAVPVTPQQDVATAVEEVRGKEVRFAGLTVRAEAGTMTIDGTVADAEDAWAFAGLVRKVPGVDRVVLGRIAPR